jgi:peptide/nickel transport system permease protein
VLLYLVRRLFWSCLAFLAVTMATFAIFFLVPGDPARALSGTDDPVVVAHTRHFLDLDHPIYVQYGHFLHHILIDHNLGQSFANRDSVNTLLLQAAPVTISLVTGGMVVWLLASLAIGLIGALHPRSWRDRAGMSFVLVGVSAHPAWLGLILSYVFGFKLGWLPAAGYCTLAAQPGTSCSGLVDWFTHLLLPWITFATLYAALYARMIRACVLEQLDEDWVRTARAKGAPGARVMRRHVLPNAMIPVVTMLGTDVAVALAGSLFVEQVFSLPGLGRLAVAGANSRDLPVTMGVVIWAAFAAILVTLVVDLVLAVCDPRVRLGRRAA